MKIVHPIIPHPAMYAIRVISVGDGLCCLLWPQEAMLDWGSQQGGTTASENVARLLSRPWEAMMYRGVRMFIASHYHTDHYNGLVMAHRGPWAPLFDVREVYGPGIPEFPRRETFLRAYFALNDYVLGNSSGSIEFDLLQCVRRAAGHSRFTFHPLYQGDLFGPEHHKLRCIWPPRELRGYAGRAVDAALQRFNRAVREIPQLGELYKAAYTSTTLSVLLEGGEFPIEAELEEKRQPGEPRSRLPAVVAEANAAFRRAANHMSLAFHADDHLLSLGDLPATQLTRVLTFLRTSGNTRYRYVLAPHHGTVWHRDMFSLFTQWVLVSNGPRLAKHLKSKLGEICGGIIETSRSGDIRVPFMVWW
jgi:hypothetical protein